jgi:hypothetical protein
MPDVPAGARPWAAVWSMLSVAATAHLPPQEAGAGSSIYNIVRQIGSVLGVACISTLMNDRISSNMAAPPHPDIPPGIAAQMPTSFSNVDLTKLGQLLDSNAALKQWFVLHFSAAMNQSMWLPMSVAVFGAVVAAGLSRLAGCHTAILAGTESSLREPSGSSLKE